MSGRGTFALHPFTGRSSRNTSTARVNARLMYLISVAAALHTGWRRRATTVSAREPDTRYSMDSELLPAGRSVPGGR